MTEPLKSATIMCKKHRKRAAVSVCYECGKPICWLCRRGPDKWVGGHTCFVFGTIVIVLIASLLVIPFIEDLLEEEEDDSFSHLWIERVEPYVIDASSNRSIDLGVKIYLTHEGDKASKDVSVELLLKVDGITYASGSENIGTLEDEMTKIADIAPFTITPGTYDLDIIIWEGQRIRASTTYELKLSESGKADVEEWWDIDSDEDGPVNAAQGSGTGASKGSGDTSSICIVSIVIAILFSLVILVFTRIRKRRALHHPKRDNLYQQIQNQPGIHAAELQQQTGLARGTMDHHLKSLEQHGMVRSYTDGTNKRFVPGEMKTVTDRPDNPRQMILDFLKNGPGTSQKEIAEQLGLPLQTVNYHVNNMKIEGILKIEYEGKESKVFLNGET